MAPGNTIRNIQLSSTSGLTLQLGRSLANKMGKVLQIVTGSNTEAADKVLGRVLQVSVAVVNRGKLILGPAEVGIARDRGSAIEVLETLLGFGLGVGIEAVAAEELVGRDAFLGAEATRSLVELLIYSRVSQLSNDRRETISPSAGDLAGPTAPKPSFLAAGGFDTCPNPSRPIPMPNRSTSLEFRSCVFPVAPKPPARSGLIGVGEEIVVVEGAVVVRALASASACSASAS